MSDLPPIPDDVVISSSADALIEFDRCLMTKVMNGGNDIDAYMASCYSRMERLQYELRRRGYNFTEALEVPVAMQLMGEGYTAAEAEAAWDWMTRVTISAYAASQRREYDRLHSPEAAVTKLAEQAIQVKGDLHGTYSAGDEQEAYQFARGYLGVEEKPQPEPEPKVDLEELRLKLRALVLS